MVPVHANTNKKLIELFNCDITCIDPDTSCYESQVILEPKYKYLDDYLSANPNKKITTLRIDCPFPDGNNCYDEIERIQKSKPDYIILTSEALGGSGSNKLHTFLKNIGAASSESMSGTKLNIDIQ